LSGTVKILTIDLEEWFHINDSTWMPVAKWPYLEQMVIANTNTILSFLKRHNIKASFFVLGWIAEQYPELIRQIAGDGHDIGYHSYYHRIPKFQSQKEFEKDLTKGIKILERISTREIKYYRAPNFSLENKWMLDSLADHGIQVSSSIKNPISHNKKDLPFMPFEFRRGSHRIIELPLNTKNLIFIKLVFSGSGYFRILPYQLLKQLFNREAYLMLYFHPNDFDTNLPTPPELGVVRNTLNTICTSTTLSKLELLANHFSFISISQALNTIIPGSLPVIYY